MDQGQIEQVIVNLVVNARDAMPRGGRISIETANVHLDERRIHRHPDVEAGEYVRLAVTDTGEGMDSATLPRIFEPFFTTKRIGEGTGLGLATVYGIVQQSHGLIEVTSAPGRGTTVEVFLPQAQAVRPVEPEEAASTSRGGNETVLLVEDEPAVRELITEVLKREGYHVTAAGNAEEALEFIARNCGTVDLLLTDVVLPGLDGAELADRLRETCPDTKVLFMSGYADDRLSFRGVLKEGTRLLEKPLTNRALITKVREVLDAVM